MTGCISRQRAWGVPIPIFYAEDDTPIMIRQVFDHVAGLFKEFGSNIWFEKEAKDLLPEGYTHPGSPMVFSVKKRIPWMFGLIPEARIPAPWWNAV